MIVIGGGDTGADCVANAHREGALSVTQIELIGEPPPHRPDDITPWPRWPMKLRIPYALKEARSWIGERDFPISTTHFGRGTGPGECRSTGPSPRRPSGRSPAPRSRSRPSLCCSRWASSGPSRLLLDELGVERDPRGNAGRQAVCHLRPTVFSPPAMPGGDSR